MSFQRRLITRKYSQSRDENFCNQKLKSSRAREFCFIVKVWWCVCFFGGLFHDYPPSTGLHNSVRVIGIFLRFYGELRSLVRLTPCSGTRSTGPGAGSAWTGTIPRGLTPVASWWKRKQLGLKWRSRHHYTHREKNQKQPIGGSHCAHPLSDSGETNGNKIPFNQNQIGQAFQRNCLLSACNRE